MEFEPRPMFMPYNSLLGFRDYGGAGYYHLQPKDGTQYHFLVAQGCDYEGMLDRETGNLWCASVAHGQGGVQFNGYRYRVASIHQYIEEHPEYKAHDKSMLHMPVGEGWAWIPFIEYMSSHSKANPWTCVAAIMVMDHFLWYMRNREELKEMVGSNKNVAPGYDYDLQL